VPASQALKALRLIRADRSVASHSTSAISLSVMSLHSSVSLMIRTGGATSALLPRRYLADPGPRDPSDRARYAHPESGRSLPRRHASVRSLQNPRPQIVAQRSSHHPYIKVAVELSPNADVAFTIGSTIKGRALDTPAGYPATWHPIINSTRCCQPELSPAW